MFIYTTNATAFYICLNKHVIDRPTLLFFLLFPIRKCCLYKVHRGHTKSEVEDNSFSHHLNDNNYYRENMDQLSIFLESDIFSTCARKLTLMLREKRKDAKAFIIIYVPTYETICMHHNFWVETSSRKTKGLSTFTAAFWPSKSIFQEQYRFYIIS